MPRPKTTTHRDREVATYLNRAELAKLDVSVNRAGLTRSAILRIALLEYLQRRAAA